MTKPVIVTRAVKGSPLTRTELDNNFSNLDNASINIAGDSGTINGSLNDTFNILGGTKISTSVVNNQLVIGLATNLDGGNSATTTTGIEDGGTATGSDPSGEDYKGDTGPTGATGAPGATSLAGLTDATITSPVAGDVLRYNYALGKWFNGSAILNVSGTSNRITVDTTAPRTPIVDLATTGVTAGTYTTANITVDAYGRVTSIANGSAGGGTKIALLHITQLFWLNISSESMNDSYGHAARRNADSVWTITDNGTGVTVGTDNTRGYITIPAGTWLIEIPDLFWNDNNNRSIGLWKDGDANNPKIWKQSKTITVNGTNTQWQRFGCYLVTLANSTNYYIKANVPDYTFLSPETLDNDGGGAGIVFKFTKLS